MFSATEGRRTVVEVSFEHLKLGEGQKKKSRVIPGAKPLVFNIPSLVPNVVIGTENVVTHALPNLSEEKRRRKKEKEKRGGLLFFSGQVRQCMGDHILCAYYHVGHM